MSHNPGDSEDPDERVITPGGPRARSLVHRVDPGEVVRFDENGEPVIIRPIVEPSTPTHELVLTPGGLRPRSQVHQIDRGQVVDVTEGQATSELLAANLAPGAGANRGGGKLASLFWTNETGDTITLFRTAWQVPDAPLTWRNQTLFLGNGLGGTVTGETLLQPLLQWGVSAAGGGDSWAIASWYVTLNGGVLHTKLVPVSPGDTLIGVIALTGSRGGQLGYAADFQGIEDTRLALQGLAELRRCYEKIEAYRVSESSEYPAAANVAFTGIRIQTSGSTPALRWMPFEEGFDHELRAVVVSDSATNGQVNIAYPGQTPERSGS